MGAVFMKTLVMFLLSFIIAMIVALLIFWIRKILTSVRISSLFDESSKILVSRARRIHKIHVKTISVISGKVEQEIHPELFDYYTGLNEEYEQPEDFHGTLKPLLRRKRLKKRHTKQNKNLK
jgi:hypothetical protein